jgi:hypothetical protein
MSPGYLLQKSSFIATKRQTVQPGNAFEDTTFKPEVEIANL